MPRISLQLLLTPSRSATADATERDVLLTEDGVVLVDENGNALSLE